jgi:tetratricopeptide (TPR) repeat protein
VNRLLAATTVGLCFLCLAGCMEMIRRPAPAGDRPASAPPRQEREAADSAARIAAPRTRTRAIREVNQYALWCIENSLWNEARSHLEQALAQDSLSASLHNNLAIVYEHFGQRDKAVEYYQRARALNLKNRFYRDNLERLERLQQAAGDSTGKEQGPPARRREPIAQP